MDSCSTLKQMLTAKYINTDQFVRLVKPLQPAVTQVTDAIAGGRKLVQLSSRHLPTRLGATTGNARSFADLPHRL